ncbi:MAG: roadblock/LC7 domain-containing protein [candidate division WOR-3 bacterium]|nr:roadblock/LC7 domain-containing protein [candidate division WOR-3 bacterium]MDW8150149.1 roadblock/LC7 domain-containing protein [candidate division WOR-3 bacterium]
MEGVISKIRSEAERFIPGLLGIILVDEYGFPIAYSFSTILQDPIVVSGLLASATSMLENLLKELSDAKFELVYVQGDKIALFIGSIKNIYLGFIITPSTKVGSVFMEYKILKPKIEETMKGILEVE